MRTKRKPIELLPFTNQIGQTISVGDKIISVTRCRYRTSIRTGTYLGVRRGQDRVENYVYDLEKRQYVRLEQPKITPVYFVCLEVDAVKNEFRHVVTNELHDWKKHKDYIQFNLVKVPYKRKTQLQLNRVFADVADLVGNNF